MSNNYAYIDGQNLHFGIKSMGWKLDHKKFREYLETEHDVTRAYIFLGFMEEHQDLYNVLQEAGFICYFKPLVRYDDGNIKGNVDADMVLQVMVDIDNYDGAVIISGDGDFSGLIRHLHGQNKLGQVVIPNREKYSSLFDRMDGFDKKHVTYMNDLKNRLQYRPGQRFNKNRPDSKRPRSDKPEAKKTTESKVKKTPTKSASDAKPRTTTRTPKRASSTSQKPKAASRSPRKSSNNRYKKKNDNATGFKPKAELERSLLDAINDQ